MDNYNNWEVCKTQVFWGEIAPCDHVVQIYDDNEIFLDTLVGFVGDGINAGDCVIVIANAEHLDALNRRLLEHTIKLDLLISEDQYIPIDAEEMLAQFMVNGWPDETLFMNLITALISRGRNKNRQIRAFGEMVALLWEKGYNGATVQLEHMWNRFCENEAFCLFCAYPKSGFTQDPNASINHICATHSRMLAGDRKHSKEVTYKKIDLRIAE